MTKSTRETSAAIRRRFLAHATRAIMLMMLGVTLFVAASNPSYYKLGGFGETVVNILALIIGVGTAIKGVTELSFNFSTGSYEKSPINETNIISADGTSQISVREQEKIKYPRDSIVQIMSKRKSRDIWISTVACIVF